MPGAAVSRCCRPTTSLREGSRSALPLDQESHHATSETSIEPRRLDHCRLPAWRGDGANRDGQLSARLSRQGRSLHSGTRTRAPSICCEVERARAERCLAVARKTARTRTEDRRQIESEAAAGGADRTARGRVEHARHHLRRWQEQGCAESAADSAGPCEAGRAHEVAWGSQGQQEKLNPQPPFSAPGGAK